MSILESIFYMIWRGLAIGILISAPMGPVGILCIQRTLDRGRKAGLYTGVGAALSDLFYCLLTGFGLSFIEEFIERNQSIIQLFGSVVLIAFSVYLFRKNPSSSLRRPVPQGVSARKNILGGFLFTFSNPLILFLIIGLFARFNFLMPEIKLYHYLIGYIFILTGALGWWYGVTYVIDKVRGRFSLRTMKGINIGIGVVILLFAAVGIVTSIIDLSSPSAKAATLRHWNARRGFAPFAADTIGEARLIAPVAAPEARLKMTLSMPGSKALRLRDNNVRQWAVIAKGDSATATFRFLTSPSDDEYMPPTQTRLMWSLCNAEGHDIHSGQRIVNERFWPSDDSPIRLALEIDEGEAILRAGKTDLRPMASLPWHAASIDSIGLQIGQGCRLRLDDISLLAEDEAPTVAIPDSIADMESLTEYLAESDDPSEGFWHLHDYDIDDDYIRLGGDYRLAMIANTEDGYDLLYISGAKTNPGLWHTLDLKARLTPVAGDSEAFDIIWIDASRHAISDNIKARRDTPGLAIDFPYCFSKIRLVKTDR